MHQYGYHIANNMLETLKESTKFQEIPFNMNKLAGVPLGSKLGVFCFNKMAAPNDDMCKVKFEIRDATVGVYKGEDKWIQKDQKMAK